MQGFQDISLLRHHIQLWSELVLVTVLDSIVQSNVSPLPPFLPAAKPNVSMLAIAKDA